MSVAVACNLSDGVVLGVDSAVTVPGPAGVIKVYENAQKLFALGDRPIGLAFFGIGSLGMRSIGSFVHEFVARDPNGVFSGQTRMQQIVEELRVFFAQQYQQIVVPAVEQGLNKTFDQLSPQERQAVTLGIAVGGFSHGAYLSEVWQIHLPGNTGTEGTAETSRAQGQFGSNWFAMLDPIRRYIKGYSLDLLNELAGWVEQKRGQPFDATEQAEFNQIVNKYEYQIPFAAMPLREGIQHVRFLVELVISHHRYAVGAPVVGGKCRIGSVSYLGGRFEILSDT